MKTRLVIACRFISFACAITMVLHCICELLGYTPYIADMVVGLCVWYFIYVVTKFLGFCRLHRIALLYGLAVFLLCNLHKTIYFPPLLLLVIRWSMLAIGCIIVAAFFVQHCRKNGCKKG